MFINHFCSQAIQKHIWPWAVICTPLNYSSASPLCLHAVVPWGASRTHRWWDPHLDPWNRPFWMWRQNRNAVWKMITGSDVQPGLRTAGLRLALKACGLLFPALSLLCSRKPCVLLYFWVLLILSSLWKCPHLSLHPLRLNSGVPSPVRSPFPP